MYLIVMSKVITKMPGTRRTEKAAVTEGQGVVAEKIAAASTASRTLAKRTSTPAPRPHRRAGQKDRDREDAGCEDLPKHPRDDARRGDRQRHPSSKAAAVSRKSAPRESETSRMTRKVETSFNSGLRAPSSFPAPGRSLRAARTPRIANDALLEISSSVATRIVRSRAASQAGDADAPRPLRPRPRTLVAPVLLEKAEEFEGYDENRDAENGRNNIAEDTGRALKA